MVKFNKKIIGIIIFAIFSIILYTQITLFVIPPIGAIPEGMTIVMSRGTKTNFIDSPDAMCERIQGGVSLLCRAMAIGAVGQKSKIYFRLPYSSILYGISTNGRHYEK